MKPTRSSYKELDEQRERWIHTIEIRVIDQDNESRATAGKPAPHLEIRFPKAQLTE